MSLYDYHVSRDIAAHDYPFNALIMAAAMKADTFNMARLEAAFPSLMIEAKRRYNSPGGELPEERPKPVAQQRDASPSLAATPQPGEVVDLVAALKASVEAAKERRRVRASEEAQS